MVGTVLRDIFSLHSLLAGRGFFNEWKENKAKTRRKKN